MKKIALAAALLVCSIAHAEPLGYPGSTWGIVIFPSSITPEVKDGREVNNNVILQGRVEQGVDWLRFGEGQKWKLNTYASLGYVFDNAGLSYNNKLTPSIGAKVVYGFEKGTLDLGIAAVYEQRTRPSIGERKSATGVQAYASWWFGWNLKRD